MCGEAAFAAIESGYYRIKSYNNKYLTENNNSHVLVCSDELTAGSYAQVWRLTVSGTNVTLQNVLTERYVRKTIGSEWSEPYQTTATVTGNEFVLGEVGDFLTFGDKWNAGLHFDASLNVVLWLTEEGKSKWVVEEAEIDIPELQSQRLALDSSPYTTELSTFFTSTACTELRSSYAAMSDADLREAMSALPASVQDMAVKVKNAAWATYAGWDKTEKDFRVGSYKSYSSHTQWTNILGFSYQMGRLSNPTGIYAEADDILQVYVGAIPAGESVKLEVAGAGQASGITYDLHEGRNTLLIASSGNCFIFYEVDNTNGGATPYTLLSSYADVAVHIEGGTVQGYFDLTKGDDNDDWAAMTAEASLLTKPTVILKSDTHVFNLHKSRLIAGLGTKKEIVEMMNVWKSIAQMQDALIARGDFAGYCNNVFSVTTLEGTGNPHATSYGTFYYEGADDIFNADQLLQNGNTLWTIAHEQGHNRQLLIKMTGTTEVSNNVFSTAALDWQGRFTSRVYNIQDTYRLFLQGMSWLERLNNKTGDYHLWECLHLYVQLYQYFHQAGNDTDFFPKLFRALRSSPMTLAAGAAVPASEDYLKFYRACCDASGCDLTEFFTAYGFFMLPAEQEPQTISGVSTGAYYQKIDDYLTYYIYVNQTMIDEAKAYVAAKGYPKCNLIFIEDRVTAPLATYTGHAEGELRTLSLQDNVTAFGQVGETGQYTTFDEDCSIYAYNIDATGHVIVSGTGAVGFKLYDDSDILCGLYNTREFDLPADAYDESGLTSGYTIKAAAGDGTDVTAMRDESINRIIVADGTTANGPATYGNATTGAINSSPILKSTWISNATSGKAGVTLSAAHNALLQETSYPSFKCLGFKPSAGNATDVLNITAPRGYVILGYYLEAGYWTSTENYTLTASEGEGVTTYTTSAAPSNDKQGLKVFGLHKRQTAITIKSNQSANNRCLMINKFWVNIQAVEDAEGAPNLIGRQITDESLLVSGKPYVVRYVGNGKKAFVKDINTSYYQATDNDSVATTGSIYYLYDNGDGTWKLKNYVTEKYWGAPTGTAATDFLTPVAEASASAWALNFSNGIAYPKSGTYYLTRSSNKLHGWASNSNSGFEIYETEAASALSGLDELTGDRWYRIRLTTPDNGFVENNTNEKNYNGSDRYPLTYQAKASMPYVGDAINYVRVIRDGGNVHIQSANGHYLTNLAKTSFAQQDISVAYSEGFQFSTYFTVFGSGPTRIIGKGSGASTTRFALYPVDCSEEGLTPWTVLLEGTTDDYAQITCKRTDVSGLSTIYSGGYIFLPKGAVPAASDFDANGIVSCDINSTSKTITVTIDPSLSLQLTDVKVIQGHQTTGKGNTMQALLRVKVTPFESCTINKFSVALTGVEQLDHIAVYTTANDELRAEGASPTKISSDITAAASIDIPVTQAMTAGQSLYFWITGDVKSTASELEDIDAAVTAISYTNVYTTAHGMDAISCDISSIGNPDGAMRIYQQQQFLWTSSTSTNKYYRIPTIMKTQDGGIVALADYRHDHPNDLGKTASNGLGGHVIDVVARRNVDCGNTWQDEVNVATGDGANEASYGYGDPAIVRDGDGTLHCLMAAGNKSYASGMLHMAYSKSTDNGTTWSAPTDIYSSVDKGGLAITSAFVTGGKGVTFSNGRLAFALVANVSGNTVYPIYSDDKGAAWKISSSAISAGDETKLEIMNDNSLLASIKNAGYNGQANRAYNRSESDASGDGIGSWGTASTWSSEMNANGCNTDIVYYSRSTEGKRDVLLHSLTKSYSSHRKDLRLYMSFDQGATWTEAFQLQPGWAAYSSMQVLDNGDLAIIYEDGSIGNEDKHDCYAINYVVISREAMRVRIAELNGLDVNYHVMFNGNEVATADAPVAHQITDAPALPASLNRAFCTYTFYSDEALTNEIAAVGTNENVYVKCTANVPFEYSTVEQPKWYFIHSREQDNPNDYYANVEGTTFKMTPQTGVMDLYSDDAYKWAFIGSPYGIRLLNKAANKPLASSAVSGENGSELAIGVRDEYMYNEFEVYGYAGVLGSTHGVVNPFTLILKGSSYGFLIYNGSMKYYSSGVSLNASLGLTGWRSSDMMVIDAETYPLTLSPINGKSYATLYLPFGVTLPDDVTAYKIAVNGEWARPTAMGPELPAETAALLVSESAVKECVATVNGDAAADAGGNALQGVLTDTSGADLNGYVLNIVDNQLGFYRLSNSGTLAAYHAYLSASAGSVKGFVLNWDELAVGIGSIDNDNENEKVIYNLAGQRISKLQKGVNIVGGKKVLVK